MRLDIEGFVTWSATTCEHPQAGAGTSRQAYQTKWLALVSAPPARLAAAEIPWLVPEQGSVAALRAVVLHGVAPGATDDEQRVPQRALTNSLLHVPFAMHVSNADPYCCSVTTGDVSVQRRRVREELLRWHPDKFEARFGSLLQPGERESVMQRVKHTSQLLNDVHGQLTS